MYNFAEAARNLSNRGKERPSPGKTPPITAQEASKKGSLTVSPRSELSPVLEPHAAAAVPLTLEGLGGGKVALVTWSGVLQETILLVPNRYRPGAGDPVAYTANELVLLLRSGAGESALRAVHRIKKVLGGQVVETQEEQEVLAPYLEELIV